MEHPRPPGQPVAARGQRLEAVGEPGEVALEPCSFGALGAHVGRTAREVARLTIGVALRGTAQAPPTGLARAIFELHFKVESRAMLEVASRSADQVPTRISLVQHNREKNQSLNQAEPSSRFNSQ